MGKRCAIPCPNGGTTVVTRAVWVTQAMTLVAGRCGRCNYDEIQTFKDEMRAFREESERDRRAMKQKWEDLANKMGTRVENLVSPRLPRIVHVVLQQEVVSLSIRNRHQLPDSRTQACDAIAVTPAGVCINSTKSTLQGGTELR